MNCSGTAFLRSASSRRCVLCLMKTFVVEMLCHCNSFVLVLCEYSLRFSVDHGHDTYLLYLRTCSGVFSSPITSVDHGVIHVAVPSMDCVVSDKQCVSCAISSTSTSPPRNPT